MAWKLRARLPNGRTAALDVQEDTDIGTVKQLLACEDPTLNPLAMSFMAGFPPRRLQADGDTEPLAAVLAKAGLGKRDVLTIKSAPSSTEVSRNTSSDSASGSRIAPSSPPSQSAHMLSKDPVATRRVVPADNSCMFASISYLLEGTTAHAHNYREQAAATIASDPETYNTAVLERDDYIQWILSRDSWGGAIELSALATSCDVTIVALDVQTCRRDVYGSSDKKCFVVYDGIHYDPLVMAVPPTDDESAHTRCFSADDEAVEHHMATLVRSLHEQRQFTDLAKFSLRCMVCNVGLTGQEQAREHCKQTGHTNFTENK